MKLTDMENNASDWRNFKDLPGKLSLEGSTASSPSATLQLTCFSLAEGFHYNFEEEQFRPFANRQATVSLNVIPPQTFHLLPPADTKQLSSESRNSVIAFRREARILIVSTFVWKGKSRETIYCKTFFVSLLQGWKKRKNKKKTKKLW